MKILLTNDDSHRSPLLALLINYLKERGELVVVVPKHEQSWRSKCLTRFGNIHKEHIELAGYPSFTIDGTPADCVNAGIYHCFGSSRPDLIVSGINAGLNIGTGFIWSSGTVGACLEANICGIPAIAFSQQFDSASHNRYAAEYALDEDVLTHLTSQTNEILDRIYPKLVNDRLIFKKPTTWNVNFPFSAKKPIEIVPCNIAQSRYGQCFHQVSSSGSPGAGEIVSYAHNLAEVYPNAVPGSDAKLLDEGRVTITPLDISSFGQISESDRESLNELFV